MNTTVFQNEIETKTETENVIKESCLDLMGTPVILYFET